MRYLPPARYEELPRIYNQHEYCIHMPQGWEPSGRTPWEGFLCGCKPLVNGRVGSCQLGLDTKDYKKARERIKNGPYRFWREIERRL